MHETHDQDLIAAYADGDLEGDTTAVEELLSTCSDCRAEFDIQRSMRLLLSQTPRPAMSDEESSAFRSEVLDRITKGAAVVPIESRRVTRRWLAVGSVAAAAVVVVGVVGTLSGGNDSADTLAAASETTVAEELSDRMELRSEETDGADDDTAFAADEATADTTEAMEEATEGGGEVFAEGASIGYVHAGNMSGGELSEMIQGTIDALAAGADADADAEELTPEYFSDREQLTPQCIGAVTDPVFTVIAASVDDEDVEVFVVRDDEGFRAEWFTVDDCEPRQGGS